MRERKGILFVGLADMMGAFLVIAFVLFALALAAVKAHSTHGNVKLRTQMLITLRWSDNSATDLDLWVRGPDGTVVGYPAKDGGYMHLDRDDLGITNDTFIVNGQPETIHQNTENVSVIRLLPGEWVVNVHYFNGTVPSEPATITVVALSPYRVVFKGTLPVSYHQERTFVSFVANRDGSISDIRTDLNIPIRRLVK